MPARNIFALILEQAGHTDESIREDLKTLEIDPNPVHLGMIHSRLKESYESKGMHKEALEEHIKTLQAYGADSKEIDLHRRTYAEKGWRGIDEQDLQRTLAEWNKGHWHFHAFAIANIYVRLGDKDQAFAWFNKCVDIRSTMMYLIGAGHDLASIRSDPRYTELKHRMGLPS